MNTNRQLGHEAQELLQARMALGVAKIQPDIFGTFGLLNQQNLFYCNMLFKHAM
jgi:hypothetical protein